MNEFEYTLAIEKIKTMKTQKTINDYLRKYIKQHVNQHYAYYGANVPKKSKSSDIFLYKTLVFAYNKHTNQDAISDFIKNDIETRQQTILHSIIEHEESYTFFMNVFEYDTRIVFNRSTMNIIRKFNLIVEDNDLPFAINYNHTIGRIYSSIGEDLEIPEQHASQVRNKSQLFELEDIKLTLDPRIYYTSLESMLETTYATLHSNIDEELQQLDIIDNKTKQMNEVSNTIHTKLLQYKDNNAN